MKVKHQNKATIKDINNNEKRTEKSYMTEKVIVKSDSKFRKTKVALNNKTDVKKVVVFKRKMSLKRGKTEENVNFKAQPIKKGAVMDASIDNVTDKNGIGKLKNSSMHDVARKPKSIDTNKSLKSSYARQVTQKFAVDKKKIEKLPSLVSSKDSFFKPYHTSKTLINE